MSATIRSRGVCVVMLVLFALVSAELDLVAQTKRHVTGGRRSDLDARDAIGDHVIGEVVGLALRAASTPQAIQLVSNEISRELRSFWNQNPELHSVFENIQSQTIMKLLLDSFLRTSHTIDTSDGNLFATVFQNVILDFQNVTNFQSTSPMNSTQTGIKATTELLQQDENVLISEHVMDQESETNLISVSSGCRVCPAGQFRPDCTAQCQACAPGKYKTAAMSDAAECSSCALCSAGEQRKGCGSAPYTSRGSCSPCAVGTYSSDGGPCKPCSAGTYQDTTGQSQCKICTTCASGTYLAGCGFDMPGTCTGCVSVADDDVCNVCEAGAGSRAGSRAGSPCALNTHLRFVRPESTCPANFGGCAPCKQCAFWLHLLGACATGVTTCYDPIFECGGLRHDVVWLVVVVLCGLALVARMSSAVHGIVAQPALVVQFGVLCLGLLLLYTMETGKRTGRREDGMWRTLLVVCMGMGALWGARVFLNKLNVFMSGTYVSSQMVYMAVFVMLLGHWSRLSCADVGSLGEQYLGLASGFGSLAGFIILYIWSMLTHTTATTSALSSFAAHSTEQLWFESLLSRGTLLLGTFLPANVYALNFGQRNPQATLLKTYLMLLPIFLLFFVIPIAWFGKHKFADIKQAWVRNKTVILVVGVGAVLYVGMTIGFQELQRAAIKDAIKASSAIGTDMTLVSQGHNLDLNPSHNPTEKTGAVQVAVPQSASASASTQVTEVQPQAISPDQLAWIRSQLVNRITQQQTQVNH